jgi:hypothetical protein
MIKLKKHSPQDKEKIIKVLDIITKMSVLGSEYYWMFEDYFKISDRHADKYDEVSEDITSLFVEGIGYKALYESWGTGTTLDRKLPFFNKHGIYGSAFLVDAISDVIHGQRAMTPESKYDRLFEMYELAIYLIDNPLDKKSDITNEIIELSRTYSAKKEKAEKIRKVLLSYKAPKKAIEEILALV